MTVIDWLTAACADAERRYPRSGPSGPAERYERGAGVPASDPDLKALLESLARSTEILRRAPWNEDASGAVKKDHDGRTR
jgi:hypothetical protein